MLPILGALIVVVAAAGLVGLARAGPARYRAGPWPGLTPRGAGVLLVCAWMLSGCELLLPRAQREARALPDLPLLASIELIPPLLASCLIQTPGCASAVCGMYLLWRSLPSLVDPTLEPPPLLLPAAVACDLAAWLPSPHLGRPQPSPQPRPLTQRERGVRLGLGRAVLAGAAFGLALALVEPPFALLLGGNPAGWQAGDRLLAGGLATVACATLGGATERITHRLRA